MIIDAAFRADPYPTYAALREAGPIHWSEEFFGGAWLLTRHADVEAVLRDAVRFSAQRTGGWVMQSRAARSELMDFQQLFARAMLFLDAPDHTRIRSVLNAGFRNDVLQQFAPAIGQRVDALLDAVDADAGFDFMQALARPLPAEVMAMLMDIPAADRGDFIAWSDDLATFIGAPIPSLEQARRARTSLLAMSGYFEQLVPQRRHASGDDLVSRLLRAEAAGDIQPGAELLAQCAMLLFAGHETTRNLLGNGLQALLADPVSWQRLQREPALLPGAVRELLRFDSPVQYTGRRVTADLVLHGRQLRRGDLVVALIASANRDPARHAEPDRLDVARRPGGLLSFGAGPHLCIGAGLTLMEAEIVFGRLLRRFPRLQRVDAQPRWSGNAVYRGLGALPVRQA
ncbi:cytochrome P450 [Variovorax sp. J22G21]|uniref:cytochrome P450 n=1 Tax=Variovorax fucosicus TaxID=3053517 RepID=UPI002576A4DA|nr:MULTISPECIES: cytochrome P450 [unclassified Variovorax]MDM0037509.1 cytochrome P450 [Variovorax sp. J22R193]MDM0062285.1 cytochrome P450 [Variovorax sp. J22G21]